MNIGWALHIARTMDCHFGYKLETKTPLARYKPRLEDDLKVNVKKPCRRKINAFTSE